MSQEKCPNWRRGDKGEWWRGWIHLWCKNFCKCLTVPPAQQ
jgi:hypothetical protein